MIFIIIRPQAYPAICDLPCRSKLLKTIYKKGNVICDNNQNFFLGDNSKSKVLEKLTFIEIENNSPDYGPKKTIYQE